MSKTFICFALVAVLAVTVSAKTQWHQLRETNYGFENFKADFGKQYESVEEHEKRRGIFEQNLNEILRHNDDETQSYKKGVNQFTDITDEEFKQRFTGFRKELTRKYRAKGELRSDYVEPTAEELAALPGHVDWREKNVVTAVKNQGDCGSCWAFSSTEQVESYVAINTGKLEVLSPQQLVSCMPNPMQCGGTGGCGGATGELAFNYVQMYGMTSEWVMPYTSGTNGQNGVCNYNMASEAVATVSGYEKLPVNSYGAMMMHLANVGPAEISAFAEPWKDYESGVYTGCDGAKDMDIDHAIQLVGYGSDNGKDYWLVRNSWDTTWGEDGYIRLERNATPQCSMDTTPADGTACSGYPTTEKVCGQCGMLSDSSYPLGAGLVSKSAQISQ